MNGSKRSIRRLQGRFIALAREPSTRRRFPPGPTCVGKPGCGRGLPLQQSCSGRAIRGVSPASGGNRLTFAPLCAKGRNPRGAPPPQCGAYPHHAPRSARRHALSAMGRYLLVVLGLLACGAAASRAEDLERGKSGPTIFAADCSACHRSAQGLAFGMSATDLMDLLRQHYTTGPDPANQVANYLLSVVGNGRRPKEKPLTEPQPTAAGPAGEQAGKRRPRGEEPMTDPDAGQRPPGEIRSNEAAVGEPGGAATDRGRPGSASKRRQQADHPAEPALPNRSKKPGQPTTATRGPEAEPARPPEPIPGQPSPSVAARPSEPAEVRQP